MRRRVIIAVAATALGALIGYAAGCSGGAEGGPAGIAAIGPSTGPPGAASAVSLPPSAEPAARQACDAARLLNAASSFGDFWTVGDLAAAAPGIAVHAAGVDLRVKAGVARSEHDVFAAYLRLIDACSASGA